MGRFKEANQVLVGAVARGDFPVIPYIVARVPERRIKAGIQPEGVTPQAFHIVQFQGKPEAHVFTGRISASEHTAIARFRSKRFPHGMSGIMRRVVERLMELGEIDMVNVFIDGTKEEANANRYTFVWKKSVEKRKAKLREKMKKELPGLLEGLDVKFHMPESVETRRLKELLKKLGAEKARTGAEFAHGAGKRKSGLQKAYEAVETWLQRMKGSRNRRRTVS